VLTSVRQGFRALSVLAPFKAIGTTVLTVVILLAVIVIIAVVVVALRTDNEERRKTALAVLDRLLRWRG